MRSPSAITGLALALAMGTLPAAAQETAAAASACAGLESPAAEIACLRALLGQQGQSVSAPSRPHVSAASVRPSATEQFGAEQVPNAVARVLEIEPVPVGASITETRRDQRGLLVMQLDNGQIWRQEETFGAPLSIDRNAPTPVQISRSGFGGYRMHFPDLGRRMVVSRLR